MFDVDVVNVNVGIGAGVVGVGDGDGAGAGFSAVAGRTGGRHLYIGTRAWADHDLPRPRSKLTLPYDESKP